MNSRVVNAAFRHIESEREAVSTHLVFCKPMEQLVIAISCTGTVSCSGAQGFSRKRHMKVEAGFPCKRNLEPQHREPSAGGTAQKRFAGKCRAVAEQHLLTALTYRKRIYRVVDVQVLQHGYTFNSAAVQVR